jgi:putative NADH-flavin reductase
MENKSTVTSLKIIVFGANGGIGKQCVIQALANGHQVTAVLRNPSKLTLTHPNLKIIEGNVNHRLTFSKCLTNQDAVISAIGISGGLGSDKPTDLYSQGAVNILQEMKTAGITRAFFISASAVETSPVIPFFYRLISKYIIQKLLKHMYADLLAMEKIVKSSNSNYIIVRPPQLTDKPLTGSYRIAVNNYLKDCLKISRADVAHFMLNNITNETVYKTTVEIGY